MTFILPSHEQIWPTKLLTRRLEEYVRDGIVPSTDRASALRVTGVQVLATVLAQQVDLGPPNIDPRYYVGTCFHESGCSNEWDTEIATASSPNGFQSVGAYQIGEEEAQTYGFQLIDMLDLAKATVCMIKLAEHNRSALRKFAGFDDTASDPDYADLQGVVWKGGTMRAYLAIAHNHGLGYAQKTIKTYGMDWGRYQARNPTDNIVQHLYGEDCVTGGPFYPRP
jgi:hypothetical protein